ncbi:MAG: DNA repair protein RadA, partial [Caldiserica bacterium]|nr:DNA repair protein RadA [Caldisericota bacterium]
SWGTLEEVAAEPRDARRRDEPASWLGEEPRPLPQVPSAPLTRLSTGFPEVDRLLGGGLIPGAVILFGGEPGVGKSTLLLQIAANLARDRGPVLYVSGEESAPQVKLRAERLGIGGDRLYLFAEQSLPRIAAAVEELSPLALVVDSLQTVLARADGGEVGGIQQVREAAAEIARLAKLRGMASFLVSHITKGGGFAGPKTVEHIVDVAIYLEGVRETDLRILRSVKNRFGSTNEVAVFRMGERGMEEVRNPSLFFLSRDRGPKPGSAIVPVLEGTRTMLVEVQALVAPTKYGPPQRRTPGLDYNRVLVLLAVLERYLGVHIGMSDVYLAVAGGFEVREPALDLGIAAAVLSSLRNRPIPPDTVVIGEIGLSGEIRPVRRAQERLKEVEKLGFARAVLPQQEIEGGLGLELVQVRTVGEAVEALGLGG